MRFKICCLLALLTVGASLAGQDLGPNADALVSCNVTAPNGTGPLFGDQASPTVHGNGALSVDLGWPDGIVVFKPGGPGFVLKDGSLSMKWPWQRSVHGQLTIDGRRLDATAPPLRASISEGMGDIGFQATALIFPTPGCWEVTGHVANASLTFVTRVVKIGNGPGPARN
jgi:hypothetical protein